MAKINRIAVTCYRADDGQLFEDKGLWAAHQKNLQINKRIDAFVEASGCESTSGLVEYLKLNKEEFKTILNNKDFAPEVVTTKEEVKEELNITTF
jgi:hypothetical protein